MIAIIATIFMISAVVIAVTIIAGLTVAITTTTVVARINWLGVNFGIRWHRYKGEFN